MTKNNIAIYLPDAEAAKWLVFQEHYEVFTILQESGVFQVRNGSVVLHFDPYGVLQAVNRADFLYSKKHGYPQPVPLA